MEELTSVADLGRDLTCLHHIAGAETSERSSLQLFDENNLVYFSASSVVIENVISRNKEYLLAEASNGVSCVAYHKDSKQFAVGGKGFQPNISIYTYPEIKIIQTLKNGTENEYVSLDYNNSGNLLASLGSSPDFMLTIWNWKIGQVLLHSKAFGQDVFKVKFSPHYENNLTTCGVGHIRFWSMTSTFTGLKLQGNIGKFGKIELTDIDSFVELQDGRVLSGSDTGHLLLWEENFVKCRMMYDELGACHIGKITYLELDESKSVVISAGVDGCLRWWSLCDIESGDLKIDHLLNCSLVPLAEYQLKSQFGGIKSIVCGTKHIDEKLRCFFICTTLGHSLKLEIAVDTNLAKPFIDTLSSPSAHSTNLCVMSESHAGAINGVACSLCDRSSFVVTCGQDHTLRCWDHVSKALVGTRIFSVSLTCVVWIPAELSTSSTVESVLVGSADGIVRRFNLAINNQGRVTFKRTMVFKPHRSAVTDMSFNGRGILATCGTDGFIFFFDANEFDSKTQMWRNICYTDFSNNNIICERIQWHDNNQRLLCSCSDGILHELDCQKLFEKFEQLGSDAASYIKQLQSLLPFESEPYTGSVSGLAGDSKAKTSNNLKSFIPLSFHRSAYLPKLNSIVAGVASNLDNFNEINHVVLFECMVANGNADSRAISIEQASGCYDQAGKTSKKTPAVSAMILSQSKEYILMGLKDGSVLVRPVNHPQMYCRICPHYNSVMALAMTSNNQYIFSVGSDGVLAMFQLKTGLVPQRIDELQSLIGNMESLTKITTRKIASNRLPSYLFRVYSDTKTNDAWLHETDDEVSNQIKDEVNDIESTAYSIQDAKRKTAEDIEIAESDRRKERIRDAMTLLRKEFNLLSNYNNNLPECVKLRKEDLIVDNEYFELLHQQGVEAVKNVHREMAYDAEKAARLRCNAISKIMNGLIFEEISLSGFNVTSLNTNGASNSPVNKVKSLRTRGLDDYVMGLLVPRLGERSSVSRGASTIINIDGNTQRLTTASGKIMSSYQNVQLKDETPFNQSTAQAQSNYAQIRRLKRNERKEAMMRHEQQRPTDDRERENNKKILEEAKQSFGDYKFKASPDYNVPMNERVNVALKRAQMAQLEKVMVELRMDFNNEFLLLREKKRSNILVIRSFNNRIREIETEINGDKGSSYSPQVLWDPQFDPAEFPDMNRDIVTEDELAKYASHRANTSWYQAKSVPSSALKFQTPKIAESTIEANPSHGVYDSSTLPLNTDETLFAANCTTKDFDFITPPLMDNSILKTFKTNLDPFSVDEIAKLESTIPVLMFAQQAVAKTMKSMDSNLSSIQLKLKTERMKNLMYEKNYLDSQIQEIVQEFNDSIDELRFKRSEVFFNLKLCDLRLISLYQEYEILLTFEDREIKLEEKLIHYLTEKNELENNVVDNQIKLDSKHEEISSLITKLNQITIELNSIIPESSAYSEILRKVFKKKAKNRNLKANGARNGGDNDDSSEDDDDDSDWENSEDEDDVVEDVCPQGCDNNMFDQILCLRDSRLDIDDQLTIIQKQIEELRKVSDRYKQREKQLVKESYQADLEMQQFQREKQTALNQVLVTIPLKQSQIFMFESSGVLTVPSDQEPVTADNPSYVTQSDNIKSLRDAVTRQLVEEIGMQSHVMISNESLKRLDDRIKTLHVECESVDLNLQKHSKERARLNHERVSLEADIKLWEEKLEDLQISKFGKLIDLDDLEVEADQSEESQIERGIELIEEDFEAHESQINKNIAELEDEIATVIRKNTELLNVIIELRESKTNLDRDMKRRNRKQGKAKMLNSSEYKLELSKLTRLSKEKMRQIEGMKVELFMLKRKDMSSLTMPTLDLPLPLPPTKPTKLRGDGCGQRDSLTSIHSNLASTSKSGPTDSQSTQIQSPSHTQPETQIYTLSKAMMGIDISMQDSEVSSSVTGMIPPIHKSVMENANLLS